MHRRWSRAEHGRRFLAELQANALLHVGDPALKLAAQFGVARTEGFAARASFLLDSKLRVTAAALHPIGFPRPLPLLLQWL